jgi:2-polyprenyl-3-methyl-5-hydroxy-6-metoxy-1,4-benzoquinol methylase
MNNFNKCPLCGSKNFKKFWATPEYRLSRCLKCGMVWDPSPPENLKSVYTEDYFINDNPKGGYANYFEGMAVNRMTFYERIKRINKKISSKERMLDVGSALGDSLVEAKKLGWKNLYGVELSQYAVKKARVKGLDVKLGTLKEAGFSSNYFDIVTLQDVIEHVKDPRAEIAEVYRILKPEGIIFVVTPDIGGLWAKLLKDWWYHYKPKEHIVYFSQKTIRKILKDAGFKKIETRRTYHVMSLEYILNRLRYYSPSFFGILLGLTKNSFFGKFSFKVYAGEIEGWGQK